MQDSIKAQPNHKSRVKCNGN